MKIIIFLFIIFANISKVESKTFVDMFNIVYRNKLYYSSYIFLKKSIASGLEIEQKKVNYLLDTIHPSVYIHDPELDQFADRATSLDFAVGIRKFFLNDFAKAQEKLKKIGKSHSMLVESSYLMGLISLRENKLDWAKRYFNRCVLYANKKRRSNIKPESYIMTFKNRCIQQIGRINFTQKQYKTALRIYNYVRSDDYIWPRFLLDKAWNYYWMGDNERALGSVMTYKAPLLRRFMVPEANYLRGLIYFEMCYFEKAEKIYTEFNENTWKFRKVAQTASRNRLLRLISNKEKPTNENDLFLYYYLKGFKQDIRYISFLEARRQLYSEIKRLSKIKSLKQARIFLDYLYYYRKAIKEDFQDFLKNLTTDYYVQIKQMRNAFVKLNLMVSLKKRNNIKENNSDKFKDEFESISLNQISNVDDKFIWDFRGGFWADELGDYAVALRNKCI